MMYLSGPWAHPQAVPPLHPLQGLWLPFLRVISDTAQLQDLGQSSRRKSWAPTSCQGLPPPFTWELTMYSGPLLGSSLQSVFEPHWPWLADLTFWLDSGPGPSLGTYLRSLGWGWSWSPSPILPCTSHQAHPDCTPSAWHWPASLTVTHGPWLKSPCRAAPWPWSSVIQLPRASQ